MLGQWHLGFDPLEVKLYRALIWVNIPWLPMEFGDLRIFKRAAAELGRPIRVDEPTAKKSRGRFARLCIEMNLQVWNPPEITLTKGSYSKTFKCIYEGISNLCLGCGRVGHLKEDCPKEERRSEGISIRENSDSARPEQQKVEDKYKGKGKLSF